MVVSETTFVSETLDSNMVVAKNGWGFDYGCF